MNVIGIVAEYNPFHNGHLYQINKIKEMYPESIIIVVLNGNFTQRGDISLINKWDKTKIILDYNVDLVVELPTYYGINSSDIFSYGALKILNDLKIDTLVFGMESNIEDVKKAINVKETKEFRELLSTHLQNGESFPKAYFETLSKLTNVDIKKPNDILAFSYINEIYKNKYKIEPVSIKRTTDYHSKELKNISSATAIREAYRNKTSVEKYVPTDVDKYMNNICLNDYFNLLKYKILTSDLTIFHDVKEGIDTRIKKYITEVNSIDELIDKIKTKRFTYNRIKRILLYILLDVKINTREELYIRPLGFNTIGLKYLSKIKKSLTLPLVSNYAQYKDILEFEYKVDSVYSLALKNVNENIKFEMNKPIKK